MLILLPNLMVLGEMGRGACGSGSELDTMGPEGCMSSGTKSFSIYQNHFVYENHNQNFYQNQNLQCHVVHVLRIPFAAFPLLSICLFDGADL